MGDDEGVLVGIRRFDTRGERVADRQGVLVLQYDAGELGDDRVRQAPANGDEFLDADGFEILIREFRTA
jgi:hypothetical protein